GLYGVGLGVSAPPAARTVPAVVTPTCLYLSVAVSSSRDAVPALTETPDNFPAESAVTPEPFAKRSAVQVPPRHTRAPSASPGPASSAASDNARASSPAETAPYTQRCVKAPFSLRAMRLPVASTTYSRTSPEGNVTPRRLLARW